MKTRSFLTAQSLRALTLGSVGTIAFAFACPAAHGAVVTYIGNDPGAGPAAARPNYNHAPPNIGSVLTAVGAATVFNIETAPVGSFSSLSLGSGVSVSGTDFSGNNQSVANTPNDAAAPSLAGYDTTFGGSNYLNVLGGTATFTFSNPINTFGAYFTGVQTEFGTVTLSFNDGSSQVVTVPAQPDASGGVAFVGFTDSGHAISSLTVVSGSGGGGDFIGVDDVRVTFAPVPEPSTLALLAAAGILGAGAWARRTRQA